MDYSELATFISVILVFVPVGVVGWLPTWFFLREEELLSTAKVSKLGKGQAPAFYKRLVVLWVAIWFIVIIAGMAGGGQVPADQARFFVSSWFVGAGVVTGFAEAITNVSPLSFSLPRDWHSIYDIDRRQTTMLFVCCANVRRAGILRVALGFGAIGLNIWIYQMGLETLLERFLGRL